MVKKIKDMSKKELLEYHRTTLREWRKKNRERDLELKKKWRDENKQHRNDYQKKFLLNPEELRKYLIRQKDNHKLRKELIKQSTFCQLCGSKKHLEIHHKKYDESKDIMILCRVCHTNLHKKNKQGGNTNGKL